MAISQNNARKPSNGGFLDIVERYWLVLLALILGYPVLMRYFKDAGTKDEINNREEQEKLLVSSVQNPVTQLTELNKITPNSYYHNVARNLSVDFGTDVLTKEANWFTWLFNPSKWRENDEKAFEQLRVLVDRGQVKVVTQCYYVFTRRDLMFDVKRYLDSKYLEKLPLFK